MRSDTLDYMHMCEAFGVDFVTFTSYIRAQPLCVAKVHYKFNPKS